MSEQINNKESTEAPPKQINEEDDKSSNIHLEEESSNQNENKNENKNINSNKADQESKTEKANKDDKLNSGIDEDILNQILNDDICKQSDLNNEDEKKSAEEKHKEKEKELESEKNNNNKDNNKDNDNDKDIEKIEESSNNQNNQINISTNSLNKKSDEPLNLSDIEDSEGNLLNKSEIEKKVLERKENKQKEEANNLFNNIDIDVFKQKIGIFDAQGPFQSGCTLGIDENENNDDGAQNYTSRYMVFNMTGNIISKVTNNIKMIEFHFSNNENKKNLSFIDAEDYTLAALNEIGAVFANNIESINLDEYENENKERRKNATIYFKSIQNDSILNDWKINLPEEEEPILLCMGNDWIACYTVMGYLRIYSIFGHEYLTLSLSNNIIAIAGHENYLAYVYTNSAPLPSLTNNNNNNNSSNINGNINSCNCNLRFKILDSSKKFNEIYDGILSISPGTSLLYFAFSREGILITYDTYNILRGLFFGVSNNWIPLLDLGYKYSLLNQHLNFWCIGVEQNEVYGIEMDEKRTEPKILANPRQKTWNLIEEDKDNIHQKSYFFIKFYEKMLENFNDIMNLRNVNIPEYGLSKFMIDEAYVKDIKKKHEKKIAEEINQCIIDGKYAKVIVLFDFLFTKKSRGIIIKICKEYQLNKLQNYLEYKDNLFENNKKKESLNEGKVVIQYQNGNDNNNDKSNLNTGIKNNENINNSENKLLSSLSINIDEFRKSQDIFEREGSNDIIYNNEGNESANKKDNANIYHSQSSQLNNFACGSSKDINNINTSNNYISQSQGLFSDLGKFGIEETPLKESEKKNKNNNVGQNTKSFNNNVKQKNKTRRYKDVKKEEIEEKKRKN